MKSDNKSRSNSKSKSQAYKDEEEEFFDKIFDVDITKPRTAYAFFTQEKYKKFGGGKESFQKNAANIAEEWSKLSKSEKHKYEQLKEDDVQRYDLSIAKVKKFLINPDKIKNHPTSYSLFKEAFIYDEMKDNDKSYSDAAKEARSAWKQLDEKEKAEWKDMFEEEKKEISSLADFKPGKATSYALFISDKVKNDLISLEDARELWKKVGKKEKSKYEEKAYRVNQEKEKMRDLYEIASGIQPKRPQGAFQIYLSEMANEGKIEKTNFLKEGKKMWDKLSDDLKEDYEKKHKLLSLKYQIKKTEFNKTDKLKKPKGMSGYNLFMKEKSENIKSKGEKFSQGEFFAKVNEEWNKLPENLQEEYNNRAKELKDELGEKSQIYDSKPPKPKTPYNKFYKKYYEDNKSKLNAMPFGDRAKYIGEEWNKIPEKKKEKMAEEYEKEKEAYDAQLKKYLENVEEYEQDSNINSKRKSQSKINRYLQSQKSKSQAKYISSKSKSQAMNAKEEKRQSSKSQKSNKNTTTGKKK